MSLLNLNNSGNNTLKALYPVVLVFLTILASASDQVLMTTGKTGLRV